MSWTVLGACSLLGSAGPNNSPNPWLKFQDRAYAAASVVYSPNRTELRGMRIEDPSPVPR